ncbi:MAG TPA: flagellar basal body rod protein FlgB [Terracidiphilus sp.]|nr:flagellar basal body rod protein FlgB [Terracidiphilus sp.]
MQIETLTSDQLERYLDLAQSQNRLTAENMANVDTPGYRTLGMDFESEMKGALNAAAAGESAQPVHVRFEDGLVARPDGNNVSMDHESLQLAEEQLKFRTGVTLLKQQYQMTLDAIHVDGGK